MKIAKIKNLSQNIAAKAGALDLIKIQAANPLAKSIHVMLDFDDIVHIIKNGNFGKSDWKAHLAFYESGEWTRIIRS